MNNDIDYQEHEVVTSDAQLIQMLNKQLVEVLGQLREKEEECSELIEFINHKNEHILELTQEINHLEGNIR
jgi:ribonuclease PH